MHFFSRLAPFWDDILPFLGMISRDSRLVPRKFLNYLRFPYFPFSMNTRWNSDVLPTELISSWLQLIVFPRNLSEMSCTWFHRAVRWPLKSRDCWLFSSIIVYLRHSFPIRTQPRSDDQQSLDIPLLIWLFNLFSFVITETCRLDRRLDNLDDQGKDVDFVAFVVSIWLVFPSADSVLSLFP